MDPCDPSALAALLAGSFAARAAEADRRGKLPPEDVAALAAAGYPGLTVPQAYGGAGLTLLEAVRAQLELSQGSASSALLAAMSLHIAGHEAEAGRWPEWARERIFRDLAAGLLLNSAASEPRLGSPSRGGLPDTTATPDSGDLVLTGRKTWVTGGAHLTHLLVRARLGEEAVTVWVRAETPGVRWEETWGDGLSLRASDSHDLVLDEVRLPLEHVLERGGGPPNLWFPTLMAATYLGVAVAARNEVVRYAKERVPTALGHPIATLRSVQRQVGELEVALQAARTLLMEVAAGYTPETREDYLPRVAGAKHLAVETALQVTDGALRVAGAAGLGGELALERHFRDVRAGLMHPPSGDAALELVGKHALGL